MFDFLTALSQSLTPLWEMSVTAAYAAAVVIVLRLLLKKRAPKQVLCLLWLVVFARLLIPVSLESPLSIVPDAQQVQFAQQLPSKLAGGGQTSSTQNQNPVQNHDPIQNQAPGQTGSVTVNPVSQGNTGNVPALAAPEGMTPATLPQTAEAGFPWRAVLAGVWLAGAAALAFYALFSYFRLRRCLFDAIRAKDGAWEHPAVNSPFILGVLRPRIYLPAGLTGLPRKFILCHERAHLRRLDHIVKPICWVALAIHWFNPMVWAAYILMSRDIEAACDEAVIRRLGPKVKADYSATLLSLATNGRVPAPCPLAFDEGDAKGRIKNVLRYRRPALWIVVVSVLAAVMAAVCLLTDPVAAKEPAGGPDPDASASQTPDDLAGTLLDPWMREVLDGERTFQDFYLEYNSGGSPDYTIHQLKSYFYGDDQFPELTVELGTLTIIDLDQDGINELVIAPGEQLSHIGYLILRRQGDNVYGYTPYRAFSELKADGTFAWSNSAFNNGTGSARFTENGFEIERITWCDNDEDDEHYFVDGRAAERDEFDRAFYLRQFQPEPFWYTYADGVLARVPISIPLDEFALSAPVPVFLDEEQQLLYRQAYALYYSLFPCSNDSAHFLPAQGVVEPAEGVERYGITYAPEYGRFNRWDDFERAVLSVFTRDAWDAKNGPHATDGAPVYIGVDNRTYYISYGRGGGDYNGNFPETFRLVSQTDDAIEFIMTGHYSSPYPMEGESYEERDARLEANWEYSIDFPMRMVKTEDGWRFDQFYRAITDDFGTPDLPRTPNPDKVPTPIDITTAAPLSAPVVDLMNGLPDDPSEWYKVAELPDDMIWVFSRNHGAETLIRWDGNFYKVFDHTAHTGLSISPQLKKLGDSDHYGPLAVISNVDQGTGVYRDQLVIYDLDAATGQMDYVHDWKPLVEDFNSSFSYQYDNSTHIFTLTYQGQTAELIIDGIEEPFRRLDEEGVRLAVTGDIVRYRFNEDGTIQIEFPLEAFIGDDVVSAPLVWPWYLRWTIRFNGTGFDTVPGSCELFTYVGQ